MELDKKQKWPQSIGKEFVGSTGRNPQFCDDPPGSFPQLDAECLVWLETLQKRLGRHGSVDLCMNYENRIVFAAGI